MTGEHSASAIHQDGPDRRRLSRQISKLRGTNDDEMEYQRTDETWNPSVSITTTDLVFKG